MTVQMVVGAVFCARVGVYRARRKVCRYIFRFFQRCPLGLWRSAVEGSFRYFRIKCGVW